MQRALVLDNQKNPLMPCHPARARELLRNGKAVVFKRYPFTIMLKERTGGDLQNVELKIDPGSKTSGIVLVADCKRGKKVVFAANLVHKGNKIRKSLLNRRSYRRSRRSRKIRYRSPRFNNRRRKIGWLSPSLKSRVDNIVNWSKRLIRFCSVSEIAVETVRFDTQKIENPEISSSEYQQGTLFGYELREYLLEKWNRKCAYCSKSNIPLEVEHIVPKSQGGSNRVSNLTLACKGCNQKKGNQSIESFLKNNPLRLKSILKQCKTSLKDAAAINSIRHVIGDELKSLGKKTTFSSGGRTKYNRLKQKLPKDHWIDAACIGESGGNTYIPNNQGYLIIEACGRGSRQMCRLNRYGFPRTSSKKSKSILGFKTGDIVKAIVTKGKKVGTYSGKVAIRSSGYFNVLTKDSVMQGIHAKYCVLLHKSDGYHYKIKGAAFSPQR